MIAPPKKPPSLLARFAGRASAERGMNAVLHHGPPARRVDLLPAPTESRPFERRRVAWGAAGATLGAAAGAIGGAVLSTALSLDEGVLVDGRWGVLVSGGLIAALLLGTLGLLAGLAVGEVRGLRATALEHADKDEIPGQALVRVELDPVADPAPVRRALEKAGALDVTRGSRSPVPFEWAVDSRPVPAG